MFTEMMMSAGEGGADFTPIIGKAIATGIFKSDTRDFVGSVIGMNTVNIAFTNGNTSVSRTIYGYVGDTATSLDTITGNTNKDIDVSSYERLAIQHSITSNGGDYTVTFVN